MQVKCANPGCPESVHHLKLKIGAAGSWKEYDKMWFCSYCCYCAMRKNRFLEAHKEGTKKAIRRVKLGLLMLKRNLVDKETLNEALEEQDDSFKKLGEILVDTGKITPRELKSVLSMQAGVAPVNLDPGTTVKLKDEIPVDVILEYRFVCFKHDTVESVIGIAVYDIDILPSLEDLFYQVYPNYLIKFYLEDREKVFRILSANYPDETFVEAGPVKVRDAGKVKDAMEAFMYKIVDFLNHSGAEEVNVDKRSRSLHLSTRIDDLKIAVDISGSES